MPRLPRSLRPVALVPAALIAVGLSGCAGPGPVAPLDAREPATADRYAEAGLATARPATRRADAGVEAFAGSTFLRLGKREMPMVDGVTGEPVTGRDLQSRLDAASAIVIGEVHGHAPGHAVELRLIKAALPGPDGSGALALEALERGVPEEATLANWPANGAGYRPMIRFARQNGIPVVHANAPREFAAQARERGLRSLSPDDRRYEIPTLEDRSALRAYRERFEKVFAEIKAGGPAATRPNGRGTSVSDFYDAQLLWDATMADSVRRAIAAYGTPSVLVAGGFHTDFDGGVTRLLREDGIETLAISVIPVTSTRLRPEDVGRADVVIYTGEYVEIEAPATRPAGPPATRATTRPIAEPATRPGDGGAAPSDGRRTVEVPVPAPSRGDFARPAEGGDAEVERDAEGDAADDRPTRRPSVEAGRTGRSRFPSRPSEPRDDR